MTHHTAETPVSSPPTPTQDDTSKADQAAAAASTAAEETKHVAAVAQEEVSRVAGEAATQVRSLAGEARTEVAAQVADQTRQQRDKLVGTLGTLGDDLDQMADRTDGGGLAADVAREVAQHARALTSYLDGREPGELLDDVRDFARRRPGTFLLGALVAGVVAGRVARGIKDAAPASPTSSGAADPGPAVPGYAAGPTPPVDQPVTPATTALPTVPPPPPAYAPTYPSAGSGFGTDPLTPGSPS